MTGTPRRLAVAALAIGGCAAAISIAAADSRAIDPDAWGSAARTAQQRLRDCAFAAAAGASAARVGPMVGAAARAAAGSAVAGCTAERTELRTMLLFEFRQHADAAQRADRAVAAATARLVDAVTAQLQRPR